MSIRMIWAQAHDRVIGSAGAIPRHLPEDLRMFRERTAGSTVVMGSGTWRSLPDQVRPLPDRTNVILSRNIDLITPGAYQCFSVKEVLRFHPDSWVIGGAAVYEALMPFASHIVRTRIDLTVDGDTRAPILDDSWQARYPTGPDQWQQSTTGLRFTVEEFVRAA